jgi:hypothetical protein
MQRLGKAWYRRRALRLFRDDTSLSATPELWRSIEQALAQSRFLILIASPEAAISPWVDSDISLEAVQLGQRPPSCAGVVAQDGDDRVTFAPGQWARVFPGLQLARLQRRGDGGMMASSAA